MTDAAMSEPAAPASRTGRRRLRALVGLVTVIAAGLFVHAALADSAATDIAGDALYAMAAYIGLVLLAPRARSIAVGAVALGWCVAVELFQLTGIPLAVGGVFPPAMLVLGTVFDARDLLIYAIAVVAVCVIDLFVRARASRFQSAARTQPPTRS